MFSRVLYKDGSYIPQARPMLWPRWHNISDPIFEEEYEKLDCYNSDLDPEDVAVDCAKRFAGNNREYHGVVRYMPMLARWMKVFQGPTGMQGAMGARGDRGEPGRDGKARSVHDLQCPHCNQFLSDEPSQGLLLEAIGDGKFKFDCAKCESSSEWFNLSGTLMSVLSIKR
jgi:hypothetical protein